MPEQPYARYGLAIVRLTIGAMFVGVFSKIWERVSTRQAATPA